MDLKRRIPLLRWSVWRMATGARNITITGQIGDGREAAAVDYVLNKARAGDIDDVLATIDKFAYEKSVLINVGDEKGLILDAAVRRADPVVALELGTYCGYGALRIARAAPRARVFSVELAEANAANARRIWGHAGVAYRVTCVVGTIGDGGRTLDKMANEHGFASGTVGFVFLDHDKDAYLDDLHSIMDRGWLRPGTIVVADNVRVPGARNSPAERRLDAQNRSAEHNNPTFGAGSGGPRMGARPHLAQRVHGHQGVDLRRRHRGVPQ